MSNYYKYFLSPEKYSNVLDGSHECDICHEVKRCFDGSVYYGKEDYNAFCFECVEEGRLEEIDTTSVDPDVNELIMQLMKKHSNLSEGELKNISEELTRKLLYTTPSLTTWQDFLWPAHCGDYCQFIKIAGKEDFNKLSLDGNGKALFEKSLYGDLKELTDVDAVWEAICDNSIESTSDPNSNWDTSAYIFKCVVCGDIVTTWDCN